MIASSIPVILASSSPRRKQLLETIGLTPILMPCHTDEIYDPQLPPSGIVKDLASRKASAACEHLRASGEYERAVIIGADTIVELDGRIFGKPENAANATQMLDALQGRTHSVYTGVSVVNLQAGGAAQSLCGVSVSRVAFKPMHADEIAAYVRTGEPLDKAGAYGIQGIGSVFIEKIEGDFYGIMGLPLNLLYQMLLKFGVNPFKE